MIVIKAQLFTMNDFTQNNFKKEWRENMQILVGF